MHALIVAVGSAGDVYPFIAIGQVLRRRGHDVTLIAAPPHRQRVERAGLTFVAGCTQAELDDVIADAELWHPRKGFSAIWKRFGKMLPAAYAELRQQVRPGETVLVGSTLALTTRLLQETDGLPLATVHLAPSNMLSADDPAVRAGLEWLPALPTWARRAVLGLIERLVIDPMVRSDLDAVRAELGLRPVRRVVGRWLHSPQRVICAFPGWVATPQPDWPPNSVCTTFARLPADPNEVMSESLQRFLAGGSMPIACSPGSAMAHGRAFFERAIAASAALNRRAVLVTPYREQLPAVLPPHVHHEPYVPFDRLAPCVAAFVHHGGIGTCAALLAAGTPQVVTPFAFDQHDNAARLRRLGVAMSVAPTASVARWAEALRDVLDSPAVAAACRTVAGRLQSERPGAEQIADLIEALQPPLVVSPASTYRAATSPPQPN